jgi:hypothetical protein
MDRFSRRRVLRGMVGGGAVTVGIPLLNYFLNGNGTALADGESMPLRFGTWFWGLGMQQNIFVPSKTGANYELKEESAFFKPIQQDMNLLTNFTAFRDNYENLCHYSGWIITRSGQAPKSGDDKPGETFDVTISNQIGRTTRYKSLTATATGDVKTTVSYENANSPTTPEVSPMAFYARVFGPDFQDPNAPTFTPNPKIMVRKSVLSGVMDEVRALEGKVGAEDKARLDQYFTGLRHLEQQFSQQLTKPKPIASCKAPAAVDKEPPAGGEAQLIGQRHKLMTDILAMAIACDQSRVFNMAYSAASASTTKAGFEKPHHTTTHEERIDEALGYQKECSWFTRRQMESWVQFVQTFKGIKEGDGTLLDNCFIVASTDHGYARVHSLDGMPMFTAGKLGGKVKTGLHVAGDATAATRLSYTALKIMGCDVPSFGTKSNQTSKEIGEILV